MPEEPIVPVPETPKENLEEKVIPYSRFKEVNEKYRTLEESIKAREAMDKSKAEELELLKAKITELQQTNQEVVGSKKAIELAAQLGVPTELIPMLRLDLTNEEVMKAQLTKAAGFAKAQPTNPGIVDSNKSRDVSTPSSDDPKTMPMDQLWAKVKGSLSQ